MPEDASGKLEPPPRTSIDDPGARDLESSDSDDHFSDANSGIHSPSSPIPVTRVEKVDNEPSYGEVPGTDAYKMRIGDAQPDEIAVIPGDESTRPKSPPPDRPSTPGGHPIPITVLEKIGPSRGHDELLGTNAHKIHNADAVPDVILKASEAGIGSGESSWSRAGGTIGHVSIPMTNVAKVDLESSHGEVPGTGTYEMRKGDTEPDIVEEVGDVRGKKLFLITPSSERIVTESGPPTPNAARSSTINHARRKSPASKQAFADDWSAAANAEYDEKEKGDDNADFGDDFDDFEEGEEDAEFGDFGHGFQEAETVSVPPLQSLPTITPAFVSRSTVRKNIDASVINRVLHTDPHIPSQPVLNFDDLDTPEDIVAAAEPYMDALFPCDTIDASTLPRPAHDNPIFLTQRSASLWSQLVAPPPLQPPNWIRSRIRRLFLVSLGVPVDLDEILPASKQKKLILPSINLFPSSTSPRTSTDSRAAGSISRLKHGDGNASSTSLDSHGKPSHSKRRKGPPPAPELDLVYARQLCTITDEALNGLTMEELREHVEKLERMQGTAKEVLEYWTKRTDEKIGDREAFEGVIENLVKHARKVRK